MASKISLLGAIFLVLAVTLSYIERAESKHTAFEFIGHLKGCHKGQNVTGVHQLKQYLHKFGYLDTNTTKRNHLKNWDRRFFSNHANDDLYDDVLESAVKSYQQHHHLKVTGTLDPETVKEMTKPRCGLPDIVNNKNHDHHHHNNRKLYRFFQGNPRWRKSRLTYKFRSIANSASAESIRSICARAFEKWAQVSHFTFQEVGESSTADIVIGFHVGDHGDPYPFDGPRGVLAHAFPPSTGLLHFDGAENWSMNPGQNEVDLESVALHEIGHVLGLGHDDTVPDAIMYSTFSYGLTKRNLHPDDIQGVRALYGLS
ncbi:hypothetical protein G4B88_014183 [Cannabis sativa]|uniref:Peptidase metallopeptidase domain-containing protein n=1 Tax=Cannabis sativa TaxID=3483 RepID=A0A7J6I188_CANSA|nr:hypothetical protein G4B88_014183 [Cannabis sativa]